MNDQPRGEPWWGAFPVLGSTAGTAVDSPGLQHPLCSALASMINARIDGVVALIDRVLLNVRRAFGVIASGHARATNKLPDKCMARSAKLESSRSAESGEQGRPSPEAAHDLFQLIKQASRARANPADRSTCQGPVRE